MRTRVSVDFFSKTTLRISWTFCADRGVLMQNIYFVRSCLRENLRFLVMLKIFLMLQISEKYSSICIFFFFSERDTLCPLSLGPKSWIISITLCSWCYMSKCSIFFGVWRSWLPLILSKAHQRHICIFILKESAKDSAPFVRYPKTGSVGLGTHPITTHQKSFFFQLWLYVPLYPRVTHTVKKCKNNTKIVCSNEHNMFLFLDNLDFILDIITVIFM